MKTLLLVLFLLATGCTVPLDIPSDTPVTQDTDPREDGWRACLLGRPVCVEAVYCDTSGAETWDEVCSAGADDSCHVRPVPAGEQCFDGAIGRCDGEGNCL